MDGLLCEESVLLEYQSSSQDNGHKGPIFVDEESETGEVTGQLNNNRTLHFMKLNHATFHKTESCRVLFLIFLPFF